MSGYMPAQALLKTLLLTCASFGASDVVEGDDRVLDLGSANCAILFPGDLPAFHPSALRRENTYTGIVELYTKYEDITSHNSFGTLRDAVLATIAGAPCLSDTYFIMGVTGEGEPSEVYEIVNGQRTGPFYIMQRLLVEIQENI